MTQPHATEHAAPDADVTVALDHPHDSGASPARTASRPPRRVGVIALAAALVTMFCAVLLPFAPVTVNDPTVHWPKDPAAPASTMLNLLTYKPLAIDARFSCEAVRAASANGDGVVLATMDPGQPASGRDALVVAVREGELVADGVGRQLFTAPLPTGDCAYRIRGDRNGLVITRDGQEVARADRLPSVSMLATAASSIPGGTADDLSVDLRVDDMLNSSPTPLKIALMVLLGLAGLTTLVCLVVMDRAVHRAPAERRSGFRIRVVDIVVPAVMVLWVFLAPMSDDDGYYSAMAKNVPFEGYVGQYYQIFNQNFTPFSWFYYFLSGWQSAFGVAPVVLRIPALVFGLVTWLLLRKFVAKAAVLPKTEWTHRWGGPVTRLVLGAAFLAWWLPLDMGVRPEGVVALCGIGTLLAVVTAVERRRVALVWLAVLVAGTGFTAHPTGFTALAPLIAGLPAIWLLLREHAPNRLTLLARVACVMAPGTITAVTGFADGSLHDFIRSQEIFNSIQPQETWYSEWIRWAFLLNDIAMGSYAKRAGVLVCVLALAWFVLLVFGARLRRIPVPYRLWLSGWSVLAAFLLLWFTPSKWTHHFGSLAGLGPAFLALMLVGAVPLARELAKGHHKLPVVGVLAAGVGTVAVLALAAHGPNIWPYNWMFGLPYQNEPMRTPLFKLDQPLWWALGLVVLAVLIGLRMRRGPGGTPEPGWRRTSVLMAVPALVVVFFATNVLYLVGGFAVATKRTWDGWSPSTANIRDPFADDCGAAGAIDVLDVRNARALTPVPGQSASVSGFAEGGGWFTPYAPPAGGSTETVWGSLVKRGDETSEHTTGTVTTAWYALPDNPLPSSEALAMMISGRVKGGNGIVVEYGRTTASGTEVLEQRHLGDQGDRVTWRSVVLAERAGLPAGADAVRVVATDATADLGGWLAFSAPSIQRFVPLQGYLPRDGAVAIAWQIGFLFPCQRQPIVRDGVVEPVSSAVLWVDGLGDATWQTNRGALFGQVPVSSSMTQLTARFRNFPGEWRFESYTITTPHPGGQYTITPGRQTLMGWQPLT